MANSNGFGMVTSLRIGQSSAAKHLLKINMSKIIFTQSELEHILHLYTVQNMSVLAISKRFNVSSRVITRVLKEHNIVIKNNNGYKTKSIDSNFFETIDTEEKAYILGFIYADGCITNHALQIKVSKRDVEILEKIKGALKSNHKIGTYINSNGYGIGNEYCAIRMVDKKIEQDLSMLGVVSRKTKTLTFPTNNQIPQDLVRHFIRGYFDGDGSVSKHTSPFISFTGTYEMLCGVKRELQKIVHTQANIYPYKNKDIFDYKVGGTNQMKKIYDYFYKDATIFLGRKKNKFEEILK